MTTKTLHCYHCHNCRMALFVGMRAIQPYRCKLCGSHMRFSFEQAVESEADQALAAEIARDGMVWTSPAPLAEVELCALCRKPLTDWREEVARLGTVCDRVDCQTKLHGDRGRLRITCRCGKTLAVWLETMPEFATRGTDAIVRHARELLGAPTKAPIHGFVVDCTTCGASHEFREEAVTEDMQWAKDHLATCRTTGILVNDASPTVH